jgi:hypothetical protein
MPLPQLQPAADMRPSTPPGPDVQVIEAPGGFMGRVTVKTFNLESHHTVITSKDLLTEVLGEANRPDASIQEFYHAVFNFMLAKGMPLQNTEGASGPRMLHRPVVPRV